jgi:hypothetical protein
VTCLNPHALAGSQTALVLVEGLYTTHQYVIGNTHQMVCAE